MVQGPLNEIRGWETSIRTATDCGSILYIVQEAMDVWEKKIEEAFAKNAKLTEMFGVLAEIPKNLDEVIKWIEKVTLGTYLTYLKQAIDQARLAIEYANALVNIANAIQEAVERLPECFAQVPDFIESSIKQKIDNNIQKIVGPSLAKVQEISNVINNKIPGLVNIDTSNSESFLISITNNPINTPTDIDQIVADYQSLLNRS
jgi:hypothetical protein